MESAAILERVQGRFAGRVLATDDFRGQHSVTIAPDSLVEVLTFLRDDSELDFDMLMDIGGVDYQG